MVRFWDYRVTIVVLLILVWLVQLRGDAPPELAFERQTGVKVGEVEETHLVIDYDQPDSWTQVIYQPEASYIKVHFSGMNLKSNDVLRVSSPAGDQSYTYPGPDGAIANEGLWALAIMGDTAIIQLVPGSSTEAATETTRSPLGAVIDSYARGYPAAEIAHLMDDISSQAVCGADDRRDAACYTGSHPTEFAKADAVARLLAGGVLYCTGWRVGESNRMFTNEHCINSQSDVAATEVWFNYQRPACGSGSATSGRIITQGRTFLTADETLDFALFTINKFSTVTSFGFLEPDLRTPFSNEQIYIPQHSGGNPKQLGIESDVNSGGVCRIDDPIRNANSPNTGSGYYCDTFGGSSGSPVLARATHKVIALHYAGVENCAAMNVGIRMELIWPLVQNYFVDTPTGSIVVNEVDVGDRDAIELYNAGTETINMLAWNLVTYNVVGTREADYTFPAFSLAPGQYIMLYEGFGIDTATDLYLGSNISWVNGGSGAIVLYGDSNNGLDFVRFGNSAVVPPGGASWSGDNPTSPATGLTLGRDTASTDSDHGDDWCEQDKTLKYLNVGCESARVLINEVDLGDEDAIEIYNAEDLAVDMTNWSLKVYDGNNVEIIDYAFSGTTIQSGAFIMLHEGVGVDTDSNIYLGSNITWVEGLSGAAALIDQNGDGVDFLRFFNSTVPPPAGTNWLGDNAPSSPQNKTSGRIRPGRDTDNGTDWCIGPPSIGLINENCLLYLPLIMR